MEFMLLDVVHSLFYVPNSSTVFLHVRVFDIEKIRIISDFLKILNF
jgi:hypothetical protein